MLGEIQNHEIPKNVRTIAADRKINPSRIFSALEDAILKALVCIYGKAKLVVEINTDSGIITISESCKVVPDSEYDKNADILYEEESEILKEIKEPYQRGCQILGIEEDAKPFHYRTISLTEARKIDSKAIEGSIVNIQIVNAWNDITKTKNFIKIFSKDFSQKLTSLTREQEYSHFIKKEGTLITGVVQRFSHDGYILMHDNYEILLPSTPFNGIATKPVANDEKKSYFRSETILSERFGIGTTVNVFVKSVSKDPKAKYQVITSRTHPLFLSELLRQNVPEVRDQQILINKIVRIPGLRAKIVVHSTDKNVDPTGACIGMRGARIKSISQELCGEKIDIIEFSESTEVMIQSAIRPVTLVETIIDHARKRITVVVPDKDVSSAVGKRGVNTKLLGEMLRYNIIVSGEESRNISKKEEFVRSTTEIEKALDVEEIIAQLLVSAGRKSIEDIAHADESALMKIEYFDEDLAKELKNRAIMHLESIRMQKLEGLGPVYLDLVQKFDKNNYLMVTLIDSNVKTIEELADLDIDELLDIIRDESYTEEVLSEMLIRARKIVNEID